MLLFRLALLLLYNQALQSHLAPLHLSCLKELKLCFPPKVITQIEKARSRLYLEEINVRGRPAIFLLRPLAQYDPAQRCCIPCSTPEYRCGIFEREERGAEWIQVCDTFCSERTNNSVTTESPVRVEITSTTPSFKTGKSTKSIFHKLSSGIPGSLSDCGSENGITDPNTKHTGIIFCVAAGISAYRNLVQLFLQT